MTIVKCPKCGALIHKSDRCYLCGNIGVFDIIYSDPKAHDNVNAEYDKLEVLISNGKFDEGERLSYLILEWMPTSASVFWLRLLAKNNCKNDEELIRKGFSFEDSADYYNAYKFANEVQKAVYINVIKRINEIKISLLRKIHEFEFNEKEKLPIIQYQKETPDMIKKYEYLLFSLWSQLKKTELDIRKIETDYQLLLQEYRETLLKANNSALALKQKAYKLSECTEDELHNYQIQFGDLLFLTYQATNSIDMIKKQHPWLREYEHKVAERDKLCSQITTGINNLKNYQTKISAAINSLETIEEKCQKARDNVEAYNFIYAKSLLGEMEYTDAFHKAGVR